MWCGVIAIFLKGELRKKLTFQMHGGYRYTQSFREVVLVLSKHPTRVAKMLGRNPLQEAGEELGKGKYSSWQGLEEEAAC